MRVLTTAPDLAHRFASRRSDRSCSSATRITSARCFVTSAQTSAWHSTGFPIEPKDLDTKKLSNAGIARVELDFEASEVTPVREFQLLFQTELIK